TALRQGHTPVSSWSERWSHADGHHLLARRRGLPRRSARLYRRREDQAAEVRCWRAGSGDTIQGRLSRLAQASLQEGLGRTAVAEAIWRSRLERDTALHLQRGVRKGGNAGHAAVRSVDGRPSDLHLRQR